MCAGCVCTTSGAKGRPADVLTPCNVDIDDKFATDADAAAVVVAVAAATTLKFIVRFEIWYRELSNLSVARAKTVKTKEFTGGHFDLRTRIRIRTRKPKTKEKKIH